ncbi:hypothetical protein BH23CHL1_BH23CHL1_16300 [soil metagenome]
MFISYDPEVDALHIELGTTTPVKSRDISEGMSIDLDERGQLIGVEILDATKRLGKDALAELVVEGLTTTVRPGEPATVYEMVPRDAVGNHSQSAE